MLYRIIAFILGAALFYYMYSIAAAGEPGVSSTIAVVNLVGMAVGLLIAAWGAYGLIKRINPAGK